MTVRWVGGGNTASEPDLAAPDLFGVATGDVVALRLSRPQATWNAMQALRVGVAFPLSPRDPHERIEGAIRQAGARFLLTDDGLRETSVAQPANVPHAKLVIATSGTTGQPKCVVHTEDAIALAVETQSRFLALDADDRWLLALSMHHVGGYALVARMAHVGGTVIDAAGDVHGALLSHAPTHVSLVPSQLRRLLRDPDAVQVLAACRAVLLGGGPAPALLRQEALGAGITLVATYGMTETIAFTAASLEASVVEQEDTGGAALPGGTVTSDDEGILCIDTPTLFSGTLTDGVFAPRPIGAYQTGDIGTVDREGIVRIRGRIDRMFISGGENVHPEEIERALEALPDVQAAVVVPMHHADFGQCAAALVRGEASADLLETLLRAVLPGFKVPRAWFHLPTDPTTPAALETLLAAGSSALKRLA